MGDRIYEVRFTDRDGAHRTASCKTSMFSGVYWTDEGSGAPAPVPVAPDEVARLRMENEHLARENEALRRRRRSGLIRVR